ncbi:hypothetical protein DM02DRAFT_537455 [Periconia macrospinosa]|uniref:SEC7 domain-containing protein n=1 Tax=Periconia macrospinosa TaxID=97972 RepID=A0A2V1DBD9_9PLEO|nr:hypothetical protein DM02DRAFT_537455 [Periconia macrospinosa]
MPAFGSRNRSRDPSQSTPRSRPTTPTRPPSPYTSNGPAMRALDTRLPSPETFFHDATPVDSKSATSRDRDPVRLSHDLSFGDGTRDSVVDNMLMSLDQFSQPALFTNTSKFGDDLFAPDSSYATKPPRQRGHTYASSHSSDYDLHVDDTASRYSDLLSRSRRSNSDHNIPSLPSRRASLRGGAGGWSTKMPLDHPPAGHSRSGAKKSSRGSNSSSMDIGHGMVIGTHRLGFGHALSFDRSSKPAARTPPVKPEEILDRGRSERNVPVYQDYHSEFDAAPEPTIPAGPRRAQETAPAPQSPLLYPAQPNYAPPQAPVPRRKGSIRSTTSYKTLRKKKSQPEPSMWHQAHEFVNASTLRDLPPLPTFQDPPAPSPTVATRKHANAPLPAPPQKEKQPGFFRRVFGGGLPKSQPQPSGSSMNSSSSRSRTDASPVMSPHRSAELDSVYSQTRPRTTPNGGSHIASQLKSQSAKSPQSAVSMQDLQQSSPPPGLTKKTSSFFRRRKKSVTEPPKVPVMPLDFHTYSKPEMLPSYFSHPQDSPGISSLRQVMNPYLNDADGPQQKAYEPRERRPSVSVTNNNPEHAGGFSPGYKPHKDATVRTVTSSSQQHDDTTKSPLSSSSRSNQIKTGAAASTDSPKLKLKMKRGHTSVVVQEDTFLADSSSCNEDRSGHGSPASSSVLPQQAASGDRNRSRSRSHQGRDGGDRRADLLSPQSSEPNTAPSLSPSQSASEVEDDHWVLEASPSNGKAPVDCSNRGGRSKRVWLEPTSSEENLTRAAEDLTLPLEGARPSYLLQQQPQPPSERESPTLAVASPSVQSEGASSDIFYSATSLPTLQVDGRDTDDPMPSITENYPPRNVPSDADRERALRIFTGDDPHVPKSQAATVLGDVTPSSTLLRKAFMELFDWSALNVLDAMRDLCGKIVLKAETQQVDRILMSLSERWCECNPNHGFKAVDVVHTICYSILLLNTDLHVADIESRMTRNQFVKNTLPTVIRVCKDAVRDAAAEETLRPQSTQFKRGSIPWTDKSEPGSPSAEETTFPSDVTADEPIENRRARSRLSLRPPFRSGSEGQSGETALSEANLLIHAPYNGPFKGWENQVETVLREFYDSIRKKRLPLHGAPKLQVHEQPSSNSLSVSGMLRRTPSVLSKAGSADTSHRNRSQTDFRNTGKSWNSKSRSRPRLYPSSTVASSRTSLDDQSVWSPTGSSTWSRYSYGKTGTSMSMESLGSHFASGDYQQAIGFANALSQAIIREEGMTIASDEEFTRVAPLLEDETLELVGAPWAKEGILKHKHHLEALDKKAKDRTWNECFAVIEKGYFRLFSFSMNSKSMRNKNKSRTGGVVGGGNWMDNAEALDSFLLRQTIASALPPPGYSKSRPHVFALSLPTGAVHLFQVGTPDIVREFVSTANYWSARLSKEPLMGGVSNLEHGWGDNVINTALIRPESKSSTYAQGHVPRPSMASSLRSSMDHGPATVRARLPGDKVNLSDWSPPVQSMMASNLMEVDQLRALTDYVKNVEEELSRHNELRAPMLIAFSPRHPNAAKAMANWERKSSYLLREIVKFRTYIDSLTAAQAQKNKIYAEREQLEDGPAVEAMDMAGEDDGASGVQPSSQPITA